MQENSSVTCEQCKNFTRNQIGCAVNGMGRCCEWEKIEALKLPIQQHKEQWKRFGGKLFYPRIEKRCEFFSEKQNDSPNAT
jgi:hypothetical protein